jgi:hypothetical protein
MELLFFCSASRSVLLLACQFVAKSPRPLEVQRQSEGVLDYLWDKFDRSEFIDARAGDMAHWTFWNYAVQVSHCVATSKQLFKQSTIVIHFLLLLLSLLGH